MVVTRFEVPLRAYALVVVDCDSCDLLEPAAAIALYRGRGFVEEGVLRKQFAVEGEFFDLIAMGIDL